MKKLAQKIYDAMPGNGYIDYNELRSWGEMENIEITYNKYTNLLTFNDIHFYVDSEENYCRTLLKCRTVRKLLREIFE